MNLSAISEALFLIGGLLLIISILFRKFPPAEINMLYGYRTNKAMQSADTWKFSQQYASKCLIILSIFLLLMAVLFLFIDVSRWSGPRIMGTLLLIVAAGFGWLFYRVEKALIRKFNDVEKPDKQSPRQKM